MTSISEVENKLRAVELDVFAVKQSIKHNLTIPDDVEIVEEIGDNGKLCYVVRRKSDG
jgi:hypothetical protein